MRLPYLSGRVRLSSPYGSRMLNGEECWHNGIDLVGEDTKQIVSPVDGIVVQSRIVTDQNNLTWQWGNYVCIQGSKDGTYYYFCHLSQRCVEQYQYVKVGELIGIEGNTGYSFGSHCHFETRKSAGSGTFNPCGLLGFSNVVGETKIVEETAEITDENKTKAIKAGAHDWSVDAVSWAIKTGILKGDGQSYYLSSSLTREEMAVMLYRMYGLLVDDGK